MKEELFYETVRDEMAYLMPDLNFDLTEVTKNNGLILHGLIVGRKNTRISPTVYLDRYYEMFRAGCSMKQILEELSDLIGESTGEGINVDYFSDYERVRERVVFKMINRELNRNLLNEVPHVMWNDLAIVFCHVCDSLLPGCATILIRNEHAQMWGVDTEELYRQARISTPLLLKDKLDTMDSVLREITCCEDFSGAYGIPEESGCGSMYVLTNEKKIFGASAMLYSDQIKKLSDMHESGLYILPSSIHEVIILPEKVINDTEYMKSMIFEVNETQVSPEERLSDNLYYYDREDDRIRIA